MHCVSVCLYCFFFFLNGLHVLFVSHLFDIRKRLIWMTFFFWFPLCNSALSFTFHFFVVCVCVSECRVFYSYNRYRTRCGPISRPCAQLSSLYKKRKRKRENCFCFICSAVTLTEQASPVCYYEYSNCESSFDLRSIIYYIIVNCVCVWHVKSRQCMNCNATISDFSSNSWLQSFYI